MTGVRVLVSAVVSALAVALVLASCAPVPSPSTTSPPPQGSTVPVPTQAPRTSQRPTAAPVDSMPSAEAEKVLASIPEPLPPGERVPPPVIAVSGQAGADSAAAPDSLADEDAVPVPTPTVPLGDRPAPTGTSGGVTGAPPATSAPSTAPPRAAAPAVGAAAAPKAAPPKTAPAKPDTCWRVQVAAPLDKDEAEKVRQAASSLLLVPMAVEPEKGRYKVRSTDCMSREAADRLRGRAVDSGLEGAFRIAGAKR